jgi:transposase InsO family protein
MPWKETHVEEQRLKFIAAYLERDAGWKLTQLCECFGVSRKTGHKWIKRYEKGGISALSDLSRAPHQHPNQVTAEIEKKLVDFRKKHPSWGARKIVKRLSLKEPHLEWPAPSTAGDIFKRHHLVRAGRRRRRAVDQQPGVLCVPSVPNEVWGVDFKGWFRTRDGKRCDPLTVSDLYSRYWLACQRVNQPNTRECRVVFVRIFREYGLPQAIRSDNGSPFASRGLGGLTRLSVWWVKLGIRLERIAPGRPDQNGRHERGHLTMHRETACPPGANASAQQRSFGVFRNRFNHERPHEALGNDVPAQWYRPSTLIYPERIPKMHYPGDFEVRQVRTSGEIQWRGELIYVSEALVGEPVGLQMISERHWKMFFGPIELALLDTETCKLLAYRRPTRRRRTRDARAIVENSGRPTGSLRSPQSQTKEGAC